jgi:hypothetical protein
MTNETRKEWLRRLRTSLHLLAASAETQVAVLPEGVCKADEIAQLFDETYRLAKQLPDYETIVDDFRGALKRIDTALDEISSWEESDLWHGKEWEKVRAMAREALHSVGVEPETPDLYWIKFSVEGDDKTE